MLYFKISTQVFHCVLICYFVLFDIVVEVFGGDVGGLYESIEVEVVFEFIVE